MRHLSIFFFCFVLSSAILLAQGKDSTEDTLKALDERITADRLAARETVEDQVAAHFRAGEQALKQGGFKQSRICEFG
jgi:hypothetical protein